MSIHFPKCFSKWPKIAQNRLFLAVLDQIELIEETQFRLVLGQATAERAAEWIFNLWVSR